MITQNSGSNIFLVDMGEERGLWIFRMEDHYHAGGPLEIIFCGVYKKGKFVDSYVYKCIHLPTQESYVVITGPVSGKNNFLPILMYGSEGLKKNIGRLKLDDIHDVMLSNNVYIF